MMSHVAAGSQPPLLPLFSYVPLVMCGSRLRYRYLRYADDSQIKISILLILQSFEVMYIIDGNIVESNQTIGISSK